MKKRFLSLALALAMCLGLCVPASAEEKKYSQDELDAMWSWTANDGSVVNTYVNYPFLISGTNPETEAVNVTSYRSFDADTVLTFTNTGEEGCTLCFTMELWIKDYEVEGYYTCTEEIYDLYPSGEFIPRSVAESEGLGDMAYLKPGESIKCSLKNFLTFEGGDKGDKTHGYAIWPWFRFGSDFTYYTPNYDIFFMYDSAEAQLGRERLAAFNSITDVSSDSPLRTGIRWAVMNGIANGKTSTTFAPNDTCTISNILTFLWRAERRPGDNGNERASVTAWASSLGIDTSNLDAPCTRAMAVTYMWKAAGSPAPKKASSFTDVSAGDDYAQAVSWAVEQGITTGTSTTTFAPGSTCTRGQIVTFIYRYYFSKF